MPFTRRVARGELTLPPAARAGIEERRPGSHAPRRIVQGNGIGRAQKPVRGRRRLIGDELARALVEPPTSDEVGRRSGDRLTLRGHDLGHGPAHVPDADFIDQAVVESARRRSVAGVVEAPEHDGAGHRVDRGRVGESRVQDAIDDELTCGARTRHRDVVPDVVVDGHGSDQAEGVREPDLNLAPRHPDHVGGLPGRELTPLADERSDTGGAGLDPALDREVGEAVERPGGGVGDSDVILVHRDEADGIARTRAGLRETQGAREREDDEGACDA